MDLSIIIVNWNTRELLSQCLESVAADLRQAPSVMAETIVVDNASRDDSVAWVREHFPWVRLIENSENVGFARANNQALQGSDSRYALLLNSDTKVLPHALEKLVAFMEAQPKAGACGARLLNADGSLQPGCSPMLTPEREFWRLIFLDRFVHRATYSQKFWQATQPQPVEVIKGACLLLRREALAQVGVLDDSYFMYTEEVDLCYRLAQAGWTLWWVPEAQVIHFGEASSRQVAQDMYVQLYRSKIQFYRKFGGESRANYSKRLLAIAYWPRRVFASVGSLASPSLASQASTFGRLLRELSDM